MSLHILFRAVRFISVIGLVTAVCGAQELVHARALSGVIEMAPERVLAWESVADGEDKDELLLMESGVEPSRVVRLPGLVYTVALGNGTVVYVIGEKVYRAPVARPGELTAVKTEEVWKSVAHGAGGFVLSGIEDRVAVSTDGVTWKNVTFKKEGVGYFAKVSAGAGGYVALRQTSVGGDGMNYNVSELWFSPDGLAWTKRNAVSGNAHDAPLSRLTWIGDRWIAGGYDTLLASATGRDWGEPILPRTPKGVGHLTGEEPIGRLNGRWQAVAGGDHVLESADLVRWTTVARTGDTKGQWFNMANGELRFVGSVPPDWSKQGIFTLSQMSPVKPAPPTAAPIPTVAAKAPDGASELFAAGTRAYAAKNYVEAHRSWESAAALGSASSMLNLSVLYAEGQGVAADEGKAFEWMKKSAEAGHPQAMFSVGERYAAGSGVDKNTDAAVYWLEKAIAAKLPEALQRSAREKLATLIPKEPVTAGDFFELGLKQYQAGDRAGALPHWLKAAELGESAAMYNLSVLFEAGDYGLAPDLVKAQAWAEKAAAAGYEAAAEPMKPSPDLTAGRVAAQAGDWIAARRAFEKGAEAGNASALNELAGLYAEGISVLLDEKKALELYKKASALGSSWAGRRIKAIESGSTVASTINQHREQKLLMDSVNATFSGEAAPKGRLLAKPTQAEIDALIKRSPWTVDEIVAALKKGVKPDALAVALRTDGGDFYETDRVRILNLPELAGLETYSSIGLILSSLDKDGAGPWARELAAKAIATRKARIGNRNRPVDTTDLRARAEAGKIDAVYAYYRMPATELKLGKLPSAITRHYADLKARVVPEKFALGYWLLASDLQMSPDDSKIDLAQAVVYLRASAEAGEAEAAWGLAQAYHGSPHYKTKQEGVAFSYLAAEHWYIEAGALAYPGQKIGFHQPEDCLYLLYGFSRPTGGKSFEMFIDEPSLRWARELIRRGGKTAEVTQLKLDGLRRQYPDRKLDEVLAGIPPEVPVFGTAKVGELESAGKRGDAAALLTLADGYATGRGLLQDDARAVDCYRQAAERGSASAMLRLAANYEKGIGVKVSEDQRNAWLRRASDAGELSATKKLAGLLQGAEGIALYEKAAAAGDADALFFISDIYQYGRKVPADEAKFIDYATRAAKAGSVRAMERLGFFYSYTKKDDVTSMQWYRKAVDAGDKNARRPLAEKLDKTGDKDGASVLWRELAEEGSVLAQLKTGFYLQNKGDEEGAVVWFRKAAASPRSEHQEMAARLVQTHDEEANAKPGTLPYWRKRAKAGDNEARFQFARLIAGTNKKDAMDWLLEAAKDGHAASTALYLSELAKTDKAGAITWLKTQADSGNAQAVFMLGMQTSATDKPAGLALIGKAVAAGNLEAKFSYGMMQYHGKEVPQDRAAAIKLITESADGGFPAAQATIGKSLVTGEVGVEVDVPRGLAYLRKASEQSVYAPVAAQASILLGQIYERGLPPAGKPDYMEAIQFYRRARELGGPNAQLDKHISEIGSKASLQMKGR